MTVYIDADGCPVVDITVRLAKQAEVECVIICDTAHVFKKNGVTTITVSSGSDSVDFKLVNMIGKGDVVVTQDYGLAAMCLSKGALAVNQDGMLYTADNIDSLLMQRHTARKIRLSGGRLKGSAKRTAEQDMSYETALRGILNHE